jgi:flagellar biosynthesis/type III secretory pathway protein FliH
VQAEHHESKETLTWLPSGAKIYYTGFVRNEIQGQLSSRQRTSYSAEYHHNYLILIYYSWLNLFKEFISKKKKKERKEGRRKRDKKKERKRERKGPQKGWWEGGNEGVEEVVNKKKRMFLKFLSLLYLYSKWLTKWHLYCYKNNLV